MEMRKEEKIEGEEKKDIRERHVRMRKIKAEEERDCELIRICDDSAKYDMIRVQ